MYFSYYNESLINSNRLKEGLIKSIKFKRRKKCRYFSRRELEWLFPCSELRGKYRQFWQALNNWTWLGSS